MLSSAELWKAMLQKSLPKADAQEKKALQAAIAELDREINRCANKG